MAETKDKVITAESLKALHDYNTETYETKENVETLFATQITPIANGGTGSPDGATGLANLLASGATVLSENQYGDELPAAGTAGRIFFKRLTDV